MSNYLKDSEFKTNAIDIPKNNEGFQGNELPPDISKDSIESMGAMQDDIEICRKELENIPAREYGLTECTDATLNIFTPERINEWQSYSREQKAEIVNEYSKAIVEGLNINFEGAVFEEMDEHTYGYTCGDGYIHLNENMLDGYFPYSLIDTVAHELRHQLQCEAMENPEKFGIDELTVAAWDYGFATYDLGELDFEYYYKNPVEVDARYFGESMVNELIESF